MSVSSTGVSEAQVDRATIVAGLRHAATRGLSLRASVVLVARDAGVVERTLWRWLARAAAGELDTVPARSRWRPSEDNLVVYARWCGNASAAWRELRADGGKVPGLRTFQEGIAAAVTPGQRAGLRGGELARREFDAYLRWEPEARNDLWEADHKQLDIEVSPRGLDRPVRPWLTLFVEAFSRVVPGWALSVQPSSASILAGFGSAVRVTPVKPWGGVPVRLRVDRGADFLCNALGDACGRMGVVLDPAPPYSPFRKGKVEAGGKGIDRWVLPPLPGYLGAGRETRAERGELLSFDDLVARLRTEIDKWNREHRHPVLGCTLDEAWQRDATPIRVVGDDRLRWMMLGEDQRIVQKEGVRFKGRYYTAAALTGMKGQTVRVLYWPHDARRVEIAVDGEWLCSAEPQGTLSAVQRDEVMAERRRQKVETDRLRRKAARLARYRLSPATDVADAENTALVTVDELAEPPGRSQPRSVSLLGLATDPVAAGDGGRPVTRPDGTIGSRDG